jgi:hypothetical protein
MTLLLVVLLRQRFVSPAGLRSVFIVWNSEYRNIDQRQYHYFKFELLRNFAHVSSVGLVS